MSVSSIKPIPSELPTRIEEGHGGVLAVGLGALGVVYGDIGTSPLYALKECFHLMKPSEGNVYGVLSLVFWSLTVIICVKYLTFILRADNDGEGGIFALLALVRQAKNALPPRLAWVATFLALTSAALLYGDGIITPSISVLSAIEGVTLAFPGAQKIVGVLTCGVLVVLFSVQRRGTGRIGVFFGPVMLVWFLVLAVLGIIGISHHPAVLLAVSPHHAVRFLFTHGAVSLAVLGAVVLCVTGGEALYADMGHFTRSSIRRAWFAVVFPSLLLNYFGQGAALLADPEAAHNPFYALVPKFMLLPMVLLATMATVIASQALITGVFSLTRQAIQFDFLPRMRIIHTSESAEGQIYLPVINWTLMVLCIATVLIAGSSSKLAAAYGVAVTADMAITSALFFVVATRAWGKDVRKTAALVTLFLVFDLGFFFANLLKVFEGGWFPLGTAAALVMVMTTWRQGRFQAARRIEAGRVPLEEFLEEIKARPPHRVPGTAVFMTASVEGLPFLLQHHFQHVGVLHEQVVLFTVMFDDVPRVRSSRQIKVEDLGQGFKRLTVHCGFMETPYVPDFLRRARSYGLKSDADTTTYFIGRESFVSRRASVMAPWRKQLFAVLARNAHSATSYYGIPPGQVVEYGIQVDL